MRPRRGCTLTELLIFLALGSVFIGLSTGMYLEARKETRSWLFGLGAVAGAWLTAAAVFAVLAFALKRTLGRKTDADHLRDLGCGCLAPLALLAGNLIFAHALLRPLARWLGLAGE